MGLLKEHKVVLKSFTTQEDFDLTPKKSPQAIHIN